MGVGLGTEVGGAEVVQGEVGLGVHGGPFQSVVIGKACVWMRTWAALSPVVDKSR